MVSRGMIGGRKFIGYEASNGECAMLSQTIPMTQVFRKYEIPPH